jgi:uncharacterized metal-binding protein
MVDISLCNGEGCDKCDTCSRYQLYKNTKAYIDHWQSYISSADCIEHNYVAYIEGDQ